MAVRKTIGNLDKEVAVFISLALVALILVTVFGAYELGVRAGKEQQRLEQIVQDQASRDYIKKLENFLIQPYRLPNDNGGNVSPPPQERYND